MKMRKKENYRIAFCEENDLATKFGEYNVTFNTYEQADHAIRMGWKYRITETVNNGYKINSAWLIIEKVLTKNNQQTIIIMQRKR